MQLVSLPVSVTVYVLTQPPAPRTSNQKSWTPMQPENCLNVLNLDKISGI